MSLNVPDRHLATLISEAAFDASKWIKVCDDISTLVGGCGSVMFPLGPDQAKLGLPHSESLDESFQLYINDEWYARDLRYDSLPSIHKQGYVTDSDCIAYDKIGRSDYYQDFLRPVKLKWFAGLGIGERSNFWVFSVQQSLGKDPFSKSDVQKLVAYREILNSAATISRQLGFAKIIGAADIMEQHGHAVIALGWGGRVVHVSAMAQAYLGKAFQIVQGHLRARHEKDRLPLERMIMSLCNGNILNASIRPIPLSRGQDFAPLVVYGTSLPEREREIFNHATVLLVITDPERELNISADFLMDYHDITRAEAKLAISLVRGATVEKHSLEHAITPVTTRNHMQGLLRKTHTHSKAELVAALAKITPLK
jgi:DNA-binding CsgD family transcriptional regulator